MAKKYNKGRKQKPNYSKKGLLKPQLEISKDLDLEEKIGSAKSDSSACSIRTGKKNQC